MLSTPCGLLTPYIEAHIYLILILFPSFSDDLVKYLRPFASEGKTVSESDINSFFEALKEGRRSQGSSVCWFTLEGRLGH